MAYKKQTKKQLGAFNKKCIELILKAGGVLTPMFTDDKTYEVETPFGVLNVNLDNDTSVLYSVNMRFLGEFDLKNFLIEFQSSNINQHSHKWNIMETDSEHAFEVLKQRLKRLHWKNYKVTQKVIKFDY